jgi:hypothetical protein
VQSSNVCLVPLKNCISAQQPLGPGMRGREMRWPQSRITDKQRAVSRFAVPTAKGRWKDCCFGDKTRYYEKQDQAEENFGLI